ncbi:MAG: Rieske 2Fe-2S domain-containing protein [Myxococcota bacterium]
MAETAPQQVRVPEVDSLEHGDARTFAFADGEDEAQGFVMMLRDAQGQGSLVAYRNRCAHVPLDLDMGTGRFWAPKVDRIICRTHGACYVPATGLCDRGPCVGGRLEAFAVRQDGSDAVVTIPASPADS